MSGKRPAPQTPSPKSGKISRITDYYKPIHHSERPKPFKRALEDEDEADGQSTKKLKTQQHAHTTHSFRTARLRVGVHTPSPRKTPAHTRLLDETDGGLADYLAGRYSAQDKKEAASPKNEHTKISLSDRLRNISNNRSTARPEKRPSSARLLDDVDGGVMDSVVGRFETTRYEGAEDNGDGNIEHDTSANDTCRWPCPCTATSNTSMVATSAGNAEDNTNNRDRYTTPSPRPLPSTPEHHGYQGSRPRDQPSAGDSPSSFLLSSPVVNLPLSSPPLSYNSSSVAWRSSRSSQ